MCGTKKGEYMRMEFTSTGTDIESIVIQRNFQRKALKNILELGLYFATLPKCLPNLECLIFQNIIDYNKNIRSVLKTYTEMNKYF